MLTAGFGRPGTFFLRNKIFNFTFSYEIKFSFHHTLSPKAIKFDFFPKFVYTKLVKEN